MSRAILGLWLFAVFTTLGVTGCVCLGTGTAKSTRFYTLIAVSSADANANREEIPISMPLGPVR